jgi:hypothetical protein
MENKRFRLGRPAMTSAWTAALTLLACAATAQTALDPQEEALNKDCPWIAVQSPDAVSQRYGFDQDGAVKLITAANQRCPRISAAAAQAHESAVPNAMAQTLADAAPAFDGAGQSETPAVAADLSASMHEVADYTGDNKLAHAADKMASSKPEAIPARLNSYDDEIEKLRTRYAQDSANPKKSAEFDKTFSGLADHLRRAGMSPEQFFTVATTNPNEAAALLRSVNSPKAAASFSQVYSTVENIGDEELKLTKTAASVGLTAADKAAAPGLVAQGYDRAVARLNAALKGMTDSGSLTPAQQREFYAYGIARLNAIRDRDIGPKHDFPRDMAVPIGSPAWDAGMDKVLSPKQTNQTMNVFVDGDDYYQQINGIIDAAYDKLFISMMNIEGTRPALQITDDLSVKIETARHAMSAMAAVNKIAAKKLEMPYGEYQLLRVKNHLKAKEIRDLRIAQELIKRDAPAAAKPDIFSPQVAARAKTLQASMSEDERKALGRSIFTKIDVKVILDGKFADEAFIGEVWHLGLTAVDHSASDWLKGIVEGMIEDLGTAGLAKGNDSEWKRYLLDTLGVPFRDVTDDVNFLHHPLQYAFGAPRDLEDVGVDLEFENKIVDRHGVHPMAVLHNNHEKTIIARTEDGTLRMLASGNHIGPKYFPEEGPAPKVRWHDAGVASEGGKDSVAETALNYELTRHWNDVAKKDPARLISASEAASWMPTSDAVVGDVSAQLVQVEPGRERSATAVVMAGLASTNKRVVIINPFFSGDEFIKQAEATADRWKLEGWDPSKPYNEKDPNSRQFIVVLSGWLDSGANQGASWKGIDSMKAHGITVVRWRPQKDAKASGDKSTYDRKAMMHTKAVLIQSQAADGKVTGVAMLGSMSLTNPTFAGRHRELSVMSDDQRMIDSVDQKLIQPDLRNSVPAKNVPHAVAFIDRMIGVATKFAQ